jgi:MFS family permease
MIVGPLLAAPLLFAFGVQWALLINALSFILSWLAVASIRAPISARSVQAGQTGHLRSELWQGLRFSLGHRVIRALLVALFIAMLGAGAFNTLYVFFFLQNLHTPVSLLGLVDAIFGVGIIVGAVLAGIFAQRLGLERTLAYAALLAGIAFVALARMTNMAAALSIVALVGICQGGLSVALGPLILKVTPRELVGRVSALLNPSSTLAELLAVVLSGYLAGTLLRGWHAHLFGMAFGPIDTIFAGAGLFIVLAGVYLLRNLRATASPKEESVQHEEVTLEMAHKN